MEAADRIDLAASIAIAYISSNTIPVSDLRRLLTDVHGSLLACDSGIGNKGSTTESERLTAAQIKKSITPNALISFIDGKPYKVLKQHLRRHGHDAYSYRVRYGLPADYPMTSPRYSARRSAIAKSYGLGCPKSDQQEPSEVAE